jgi:serine/threonine protein kinase
MKDVIEALVYLHDNSIVHGDIKGANILVQSSGRACVADLGFSRIRNATTMLTWTTIQSVASVGTLPWQAPEVLQAQCSSVPFTPTPAGDMYSLGCLVYEVRAFFRYSNSGKE